VEDTTIFCRTGLDFGTHVSHHVRHLKAAALARSERDGKMVMPVATITRGRYEQLAGRVKLLSWLSLVWMTVEGAVAIAVGLLGNALAGAWWLDPTVGLLIAVVAVKEGAEAWQGEGCCVSSPLDGVGFTDDACHDDCRAV
jgi:hypothetical protein